MGRKVNPIGFRIGTTRTWTAKWYAGKVFKQYLQEDIRLRKLISTKYGDAAISLVEIERGAEDKISVTLHTARPGMVIGRGGSRVEEIRRTLNDVVGSNKKLQLNIKEISRPELDAYLVARSIAEQIERRVAYRRAMKQAIFRTLQSGALGIKISAAGRLGGVEIARKQVLHQGRVPLHTLRADVDYGLTRAHTAMGDIGIKVWIYRGDILPELKREVSVVSESIRGEEVESASQAKKAVAKRKPVVRNLNESVVKSVATEEKPAETDKEVVVNKTRSKKSSVEKLTLAEEKPVVFTPENLVIAEEITENLTVSSAEASADTPKAKTRKTKMVEEKVDEPATVSKAKTSRTKAAVAKMKEEAVIEPKAKTSRTKTDNKE